MYSWLHYCEITDSVFCHTCKNAKLVGQTKVENCFISVGFRNWKKALSRFSEHEKSDCHHAAVEDLAVSENKTDVAEMLSEVHEKEKQNNRKMLLQLIRNVRFLARQNMPLRGADQKEGNFFQLLKLESETNPFISNWLQKNGKYLSKDIQNEMLQIMALGLLREISGNIKNAVWYTLMADEVTDCSNKEQFVICIRWVNDMLEVEEAFVGVCKVDNITADTLTKTLKDVLIRMNLKMENIRGQCYDGASNMMGSKSGLATKIQQEAPKALATHCYGHSLQLAICDTMKSIKHFQDAFDTVSEISKLIKYSPKRNAIFDKLKDDVSPGTPGIRVLCPTRWTVRGKSLQSIIDNYEVLQETWDTCLEEKRLDSETKSRINGIKYRMNSFDFFFGLHVAARILNMTDNLSRTLQQEHLSASEGQEIARGTVSTLVSLREESAWNLLWETVCKAASNQGIPEPALPRRRKCPIRYKSGTAEAEFSPTPKEFYHRVWNEGFDFAIQGIKERFGQKNYVLLRRMEDFLAQGTVGEDLDAVSAFYGSDFDVKLLITQFEYIRTVFTAERAKFSWIDVLSFAKGMSQPQRGIISEVVKLLKLLLLVPATNASSERSASALRRIKTYLRSTMSQPRLNHLMLLHIHKDLTDDISVVDVANEFVNKERRFHTFGHF